jgi:hypothetical protein
MANNNQLASKEYDLLILVDATYSMVNYLQSLHLSLPRIISLSTLTDGFSRIGLLAYRDYCDKELTDWSGWLDISNPTNFQPDIIDKASKLDPFGGGDYPEATKTGLTRAYEVMRPEATTIVLLYTDAPPHIKDQDSENYLKEQRALKASNIGKLFMDWTSVCRTLQKDKIAQVFPILAPSMRVKDAKCYQYLAEETGGTCFYLDNSSPITISKVTIDLLLTWMGVEKLGVASAWIEAKVHRYKNSPPRDFQDETLLLKCGLLEEVNIEVKALTSGVLKAVMPKRKIPVQDFAKRYVSNNTYKEIVIKQLQKIINEDVSAISLNPVFGSLWRSVCNDRENPARDNLIQSFGLQVERISDTTEKSRMNVWLAESYDYTAEVLEIISTVPVDQRFPCAYLDPTLKFEFAKDIEEDEESRPITQFNREELLEIGRSCDYKILRRLGRVLTRLSIANSLEELPAHIAKAKDDDLIKIPLALARKDLGRKFWKILLHTVVHGTLLSARPAALLAALTIKLGIQPLLEAADQEMLLWRNKWNDLEIPETWNTNCLSLLLDADKAFITRQSESNEKTVDHTEASLLTPADQMLFDRLVSYKMLELNMQTTLIAKVGWKPEKSTFPIGPVIQCKSCELPRSVTIMAPNGICGLCVSTDFRTPGERQERLKNRVSKDDTETTDAIWVECNIRNCHAQYVVYNPNELNVKPKCYYCRVKSPSKIKESIEDNVTSAPYVECTTCLNRMIWPEEYRASNMDQFLCICCSNNMKSTIDIETSANDLSKENGMDWVLVNHNGKIKELFNGRSLFHTISQAGTASFCDEVQLFPQANDKLSFLLDGKVVHNADDVRAQLTSWVERRRTESGTCSLCFSHSPKGSLLPACGRSGCTQKICKNCQQGWYGLNKPGRIINTAAVACPFCRRAPTAKTLWKYGFTVQCVGDLKLAIEQAGEWIYAWCRRCSHAKSYMERSCAREVPVDIVDWICEDCKVYGDDEIDRKECPECGILTEKVGGCDHIECQVPTCGTHWCFFCGEKSTEDDIYGHMDTDHGGYYH